MDQLIKSPRLPFPIARPLSLLPERLQSLAAAQALNRVFARERLDGDLDFLDDRCIRIHMDDADNGFCVQCRDGLFQAAESGRAADLTIGGALYDYLLLITGREDPDTLFFQRRLRMEGNTGLGVYIKNFLASVDPDSLPLATLVQPALQRGLKLYEKIT